MTQIDRSRRRQSGHAVVWLLVIVALFAAVLAAATASEVPMAPVVVAACIVVAALGLAFEFRRDPFESARSTAQIAFLVAFFASLPIFLDEEPASPGVWAFFLGSAGLGLGCWIYRAFAHHATDRLPNLLLDRFDRGAIREQAGIQFVTWADRKELVAGERFDVHVMAQSCWDEPRTFGLKIVQEQLGKKWTVIHEQQAEIEIAGGEAVLISVPVLTHPKAKGQAQLSLTPFVRGKGGARVRRFRAQAFETKTSGSWLQVLALTMGIFVWGGGITFRIKIRKGDKQAEPPEGPLPIEVETLYSPEPTELKAIAMGVIG
jgi:hypothetical protein